MERHQQDEWNQNQQDEWNQIQQDEWNQHQQDKLITTLQQMYHLQRATTTKKSNFQ